MIHAKQYGSKGPALIVIHGLFGNADNWHSISQSLSDTFTVYCLDLPNHGKSSPLANATYPNMAKAVLEWVTHCGLDHYYLLGHSMGGKVAMQMAALASPDTIQKLIVVDIAPVDYQPSHTQILAGLNAIDSVQPATRKEADSLLAQYEASPAVRQFLLKNLTRTEQGLTLLLSLDNIASSYTSILKKPDIVSPVKTPTLFIKGEHSDYIVPEYQEAIMSAFPNSTFRIIPETGHWLHAEKPVPFISLVKRFLSR